jgi:F-type H+-transporting ATPase subunit epsilon
MAEITFELITPEGVKFSEECYEVLLPTPAGEMGILPHHVPLVSLAVAGVISVRKRQSDADSQLEHFATSGGMIEIDGKKVRLLADTAEHADDIDAAKAQEALERARELAGKTQDHVAVADATAIIERNMARIRVADLRRRHHKQR